MEDIFYVLGAILWLAFSIWQGRKKARRKTAEPGTTEKNAPTKVEDWLNELLTEDEVEEVVEVRSQPYMEHEQTRPSAQPASGQKADTPFSYDDIYEEPNRINELLKKQQEENLKTEKVFLEMLKTTRSTKKKIKVNLRQAVVYDAILNRPYA